MIDLLQQHLLPIERRFQTALVSLPFDRHSEDIGRSLQEGDVLLAELSPPNEYPFLCR